MFGGLKPWIDGLIRLVYPEVCEICGVSLVNGESVLCTGCNSKMPRTFNHRRGPMSPVHRRIFGKTPVERVASMFDYVKQSQYARLVHLMKYNNRPDLAVAMGRMFARELVEDDFFNGITRLVPVPVHFSRRLKRGYNQTEKIAEGISKVTSVRIVTALTAVKAHSTQTTFSAYERWQNVRDIYKVTDVSSIANQHIALIDDVITTGSTIVSCCEAIRRAAPTTRISVITLGATKAE